MRGCVSLYSFLSSNAARVIAIDIFDVRTPTVDKLQFFCADDLKIEIEQTDLLFIDTAHNYIQLKQELSLKSSLKPKKSPQVKIPVPVSTKQTAREKRAEEKH